MPITLELLVDARHVKEVEAKLKEPGFWESVLKDVRISKAEQNGGPWPACESDCSDDEVAEDCLLSKEDVTVHHCFYCRRKDIDDDATFVTSLRANSMFAMQSIVNLFRAGGLTILPKKNILYLHVSIAQQRKRE